MALEISMDVLESTVNYINQADAVLNEGAKYKRFAAPLSNSNVMCKYYNYLSHTHVH